MPGGLLSAIPGSWQGGSWVSVLLDDVFCWTPSQDLALWSCVLLSFMSRSFNSPAHQLLLSFGAVLSALSLLAFVVWFVCSCCFWLFCLVLVLLVGFLCSVLPPLLY